MDMSGGILDLRRVITVNYFEPLKFNLFYCIALNTYSGKEHANK